MAISLIWTSPLGLSDTERGELERFIQDNHETAKTWLQEDPLRPCIKYSHVGLCRSYYQFRDDILIDAKHMVGKGGETEAWKYYSPLSGTFFVRKQLPLDDGTKYRTLEIYNLLKEKPGCVSYRSLTYTGVIEPCYDRTLKEELLDETFKSTAEKLDALAKISIGIKSIHTTHHEVTWQDNGRRRYFYGPLSHRDLKPSNIFSIRSDNGLRLDIGDYIGMGSTNRLACTYNYVSPQIARIFLDTAITELEVVQFSCDTGVQTDIWQLGLIFTAILKNKFHDDPDFGSFAPLGYIEKLIPRRWKDKMRKIATLTQDEVDQNIQSEIDTVTGSDLLEPEKKAMEKCWKIVKKMLQVDAHKRPYIEKVQKKTLKSEKTSRIASWEA